MKTEEEVKAMLIKAQQEKDEAMLAEFRKFGEEERLQLSNYRHWLKWRECGYEGKPIFDEYGWLKNEVAENAIEHISLWHNDWIDNFIEVAQLPNGKWVCGYDYMLSESGGCAGCSIWHKQYASRGEAIRNVTDRIKEQIERGTTADKKHLKDIERVQLEAMQLSLF